MATKFFGLLTTLLLLSACILNVPTTPSTGQLETSVFQTLTALPSYVAPTETSTSTTPSQVIPTATTAAPVNTLEPTSTTNSTPATYPATVVPSYSPLYADQFIYYYYNNINLRNYQLTWSLLTDSFKYANNSAAEGGFLGYADFWDSVRRVDIFSVTITSLSGIYATVNVNMQYNYKNGSVVPSLQPFNLIYDSTRGTWLFNSFTTVTTPPAPPAIAQTPEQFITGYFANVNAGNLSLTWTLLTDRFKLHVNNNSYDDYTSFWNSVSRVDVTSISVASQIGLNATVDVILVFNYKSGVVTSSPLRYYLVYDTGRSTWLFDSP